MRLFLTEKMRFLIPKDQNNTEDPSKYRPTIYHSTNYIMSDYKNIHLHCERNNIFTPQQKGCVQRISVSSNAIDCVICN